jgi:hypothetical protein
MTDAEKTHYRKAFDSPYLSSADITAPTVLTVKYVRLEPDKTKKTKDVFNTAYFTEKEIRQGEALKPMILNATNSRTMRALTGTPYIDDWLNVPITVYVDTSVRFGKDTVEGLRISTEKPVRVKPELKRGTPGWDHAIAAFKRDGNLDAVTSRVTVKSEDAEEIKKIAGAA